jgi:hypothetical protein
MMAPLINTPLQRGVPLPMWLFNRFNGFSYSRSANLTNNPPEVRFIISVFV